MTPGGNHPDEPLLQLADVRKHFEIRSGLLRRTSGYVYAVDGVSLALARHETLGIVGESGCGKSTLAKVTLKLVEPSAGEIWLDGKDITALGRGAMRPHRRDLQIIFQDPYSSLNPRLTARDIVGEPLLNFRLGGPRERQDRVEYLFSRVGLNREHLAKYPSEFSGGQRQRLGIARALATKPKIVICDEAVAALDVSVRAQIINLLADLQQENGFSYMFISHDIAIVQHLSHRIAVMYLGRIVEIGTAAAIFSAPAHPYTKALFGSVLQPVPGRRPRNATISGDVASPIDRPSGCHFRSRCRMAAARCAEEAPVLRRIESGREVACHFA
jgi:peptide/nickel transport system ATP-binding protein/oligopeptide transport system ATP-binding protein